MRCLFSELTMRDQVLAYSVKSEFQALERHAVVSSAPDVWLSELVRDREQIKQAVVTLTNLGL